MTGDKPAMLCIFCTIEIRFSLFVVVEGGIMNNFKELLYAAISSFSAQVSFQDTIHTVFVALKLPLHTSFLV
jgi:hypothetical protein